MSDSERYEGWDTHDLRDHLLQTERDLAEARGFIAALFSANDWPEGGDLDMFDFQDLAVKHGILIPREVAEPCNVGCEETKACHCAEYGDFPQTCYRMSDWLIDLHAKGEGER